MRRSIIFLASVIAVVCMILSASMPVLAADTMRREVRSGSSTISLNSYAVIGEFITDQSQSVTPDLSYTVFTIGDNGPVYYDIMLMDESNFNHYKNNENFTYISEGSKIGQSGQSVSVSNLPLAQNTHFFLVADNTNLPAGGSIPTQELRIGYVLTGYDMSIQFPSGNPVALALIAIVAIVVLVVIVLALLFLFMRKKKGIQQPSAQIPTPPEIRPATAEGNCPVCGKSLSPEFVACPYCGNRLK
ncbi:MAG: zinc ribbon domain-containing protein [Methanomassiliicoccales archaeon]|jgi:hypothetical protein